MHLMTADEGRVDVTFVHDFKALAAIAEEWEELALNALEANVFYEPAALLPAIERFVVDGSWRVALIRLGQRLIGIIPLQNHLTLRGYRTRFVQELMRHEQSFLHTPLIDRRHARVAIRAWLKECTQLSASGLIVCPRMTLDGPISTIIREEIAAIGGGCREVNRFERPLFVPADDAGIYLKRTVRGKRRWQIKRARERLAEMGPLACSWLGEDADISGWTDSYIQLEAKGWKGRKGGAIVKDQNRREYFAQVLKRYNRLGRLMLAELNLKGKPVAMTALLCAAEGDKWFGYKMAYDEDFRSFAPGIILQVEFITRAHEKSRRIAWADSCTSVTNSKVLSELWSDSVAIGQLELAMPGMLGWVSSKAYGYARRGALKRAYARQGDKA